MMSYLWWALSGFPRQDGRADQRNDTVPSSLLEAEGCELDLRTIHSEEAEMEESLAQCLRALKRAQSAKAVIAEGYETLIMSTHDALEYPVLLRGATGGAKNPLFEINPDAFERIAHDTDAEEDDDDLSEPNASDYSDEDIANALRSRGSISIDVPSASRSAKTELAPQGDAPESSQPPSSPVKSRRTVRVYELSQLAVDDFAGITDFAAWREWYALWTARNRLLSKETRFDLLGKVDDECERLDERLFDLRIKLSSVKAKKRRADYQLEAYQEAVSHYEAPDFSPSGEGTSSYALGNVATEMNAVQQGVPREADQV